MTAGQLGWQTTKTIHVDGIEAPIKVSILAMHPDYRSGTTQRHIAIQRLADERAAARAADAATVDVAAGLTAMTPAQQLEAISSMTPAARMALIATLTQIETPAPKVKAKVVAPVDDDDDEDDEDE
jgi:hypothetical protein